MLLQNTTGGDKLRGGGDFLTVISVLIHSMATKQQNKLDAEMKHIIRNYNTT